MIRHFNIRQFKFFKNYVFLLSVFEGCAFWSAHEYNGGKQVTISVLSDLFQTQHNTQVEGMLKEAIEKEQQEYMELTIEEDAKTKKILDSLPEEKRKLIFDQFNQPIQGGENEKL